MGSELNPLYVMPVAGLGGGPSSGGIGDIASLFGGGDNSGGGDSGGGFGGFLQGLISFLPHFAGGGDPTGPSVVGEDGPELFVPKTPGTIVPHGQSVGGGGGPTVIYHIDARGSDNSAATEFAFEEPYARLMKRCF